METDRVLDALQGFTVVRRIELLFDADEAVCDLRLELARNESLTQPACIVFEGAADVELRSFGGGLNQLMCLAIEDVSASGRERINYRVYEVEHGHFSLRCRRIRLENDQRG